ncbi:MAG: hypothetical protein KDD42_06540, partial [Bdellovibrionales bacterium]|nr:hypothetical protein [Bdellovibrionales bacterium]
MAKDDQEELRRSLEFQTSLNALVQKVHEAESFNEVMPAIEQDLLALLNAERVTVYQRGRSQREIVSKYK